MVDRVRAERADGFIYGVLISGYAWLAFNGGFQTIDYEFRELGIPRGASLILELYIVGGFGVLIANRGLTGTPTSELLGPSFRSFLVKSAVFCISLVSWFFIFDIFGFGLFANLLCLAASIAATVVLISRWDTGNEGDADQDVK